MLAISDVSVQMLPPADGNGIGFIQSPSPQILSFSASPRRSTSLLKCASNVGANFFSPLTERLRPDCSLARQAATLVCSQLVIFLFGAFFMLFPITDARAENATWTPDPEITAALAADPGLLQRKLESSMRALLNQPASLTVELTPYHDPDKPPSLGHLQKVHVITKRGSVDNLIIDVAELYFEEVQLNTTKLIRDEKIDPHVVRTINMDVLIRENDLNTFLEAKARGIKVDRPKVVLSRKELKLSGSTKYGIVKVSFTATGNFSIKDSKEIWFHAKNLKLNSMTMPRAFVGSLIKRINPVLNLEKFPFRLNLREIIIDNGSMRFTSFR